LRFAFRPRSLFGIAALVVAVTSASPADASAAREYLDQARTAAGTIDLPGDKSAALRSIACLLAGQDPQVALEIAAGIRRPSDAARALAAAARQLAESDPRAALQASATAGRLLLRMPNRDHRLVEERLLLGETAVLGEEALFGGSELTRTEGLMAVLLGLARSDPAAALELLGTCELTGPAADRVLMAATPRLALTDPDVAVEQAATIESARLRDETFWLIAEERPAAEAVGIAQRMSDSVMKAATLASGAARMVESDPEAALLWAQEVGVAQDSALAQVAVALAGSDRARGLEVAASLPELPRRWALGRIAVDLAATEPEEAAALLAQIEGHPETVRVALARMASVDPGRAIRLAGELLSGEPRDEALAAVVGVLARSDLSRAATLVWTIDTPRWRGAAVRSLAPLLAREDPDAATSLIGLVPDAELARGLRAKVAATIAAHHPEMASRLLVSLPPSDRRSEAGLEAAAAVLSGGGTPEEALKLATIGVGRDLALRWLVPTLARSRARSPINLAEEIESSYLRALSLVDAAREVTGGEARCRAVPERAGQVRPIVEWEGG
jgi:hypothetical protein